MHHTLRMSFLLCLALLSGPLSALCSAQAMEPEHYSFKVGNWELNAVKDTDDAFLGFWAIPRSALSVGNIRRMWFEAMPNDEWNVYAYEPVSAMQKAADLYNNEGMSEESLTFFYSRERKAIAAFTDQDVDGGVEGLIWKGFIEGDPLTETVAALSDPEPMIDLLADVSYAVAPGMSELLVTGTAGSTYNMNPATKQLLNCLRSTMSACGGCVCVENEAMIERGPWTVTMTLIPPPFEKVRCDYSRVITHTFFQHGEYPDDCTECDEGTADNPSTWTEIEEYTDYWLDIDECPERPVMPR
ncbi:MAG: hypothetical protein ACF8MF_12570 [Phycisphaerales bacterium JB052]